jgi:hypothetical protein
VDRGAVDVALERDALIGDAVDVGEREHLEPAAVGEDRPRPGHEAVQVAEVGDDPLAWAEHEVVRVAQDDL